MNTKYTLHLLVFLLFSCVVQAQQDAQYTQYMYNTINVNPAYAGSRGVTSIFVMHRTQWVGLDGAPVTNTASINKPINDSNLGYGISFVNDRIGVSDENTISVDFSYSVKTSEEYKLSFGIKAAANILSVDYSRLTIRHPDDVLLSQQANIDNRLSPNFGAGVYFHSDKNYVGLSVPNFLETKHYDDNMSSLAKERMHFYLIAGSVFDLNETLKFKPALMTKMVQGAPLQIDLSANFLFYDKFFIGAAYRWSAALSGMVGFQVSDSWHIGYSYDAETTKLVNYNSGSHEVFLRYELFRNYSKIVSPRFF
ncbi:type IX secretion system PorP/SprF family membrane protein [Flavobacterium arsenatis]|uniref:Type IX secretion system PorP/SprF family membrane protein n=1 Tax=Flavobacterium arsenatis TaxID=1484332 RepID=A0ABU1TJT5_9FLAO|nr:type IX secretion system membrane protein PorP/SprF [Flavobacterium arsenatis]MDR6966186.1 type IX secretion system PorP/SprF family membrane protein [Flavobacterium arsenatis]